MNNEITQEEREQVLEALEEAEDVGSICFLRKVFVTSEECDQGITCNQCYKQVKDRLIAFLKSAPTKKNMRAVELADKIESEAGKGHSISYIIESALHMDHCSTFDEVARELCNVLRNIDAPDDKKTEPTTQKCIPLPKDKNGDPVDVGDVCFKETGERVVINRIYYYGGNNIFAFDTQDKKIKTNELIKAKDPRNFYALKNELTYAVHYDTNLLTSFFKDVAAYMLPEIQGAEDEETREV